MNKTSIILAIALLVMLFLYWDGCNDTKQYEAMYNASNDTLHKTINELGQEKTTTALLHSSISDLKKIHASDSSALKKLKDMVTNQTISATYLSNVTGNTIGSETTIASADTVWKDSIAYVYPEYRDTISNKWENFVMAANRDSFKLDYKVFNEYQYHQYWKKNGLFKRKTPEVSVINLNPHTETKELKAFTLKEDKGNRLRDALIGAAVGAAAVIAVNKFVVKIPIKIKI